MPYVVRIYKAACAAHGDCAAVAPDVFRVDEVAEVVGAGDDALLLEAAAACPSVAITVIDSDSGEQIYP